MKKRVIKCFTYITLVLLIGYCSSQVIADTLPIAQKSSKTDSTIAVVVDTVDLPQVDQSKQEEKAGNDTIEPSSLLKYISFSKIIWSIIIIVITYFLVRVLTKIISIWAELTTKHRVTIKGIIPIMRVLIWTGVLVFIFVSIIRPPMATMLAFAASVGVAIGFASQDLLKNIFGGITIIIDRPFKAGDKIEVGEYYGEVKSIGLRSTRIITPDDSLVSVPNAEIMNQSVANSNSGEDNCQVVTEFFLPVDIDIEKVKPVAFEAATVSRYVYLNKPILVLFEQENVGHRIVLKMKIKAYVNDPREEFRFKSDITELLTKELYIKNNINLDCEDL